jgi:hypothetical protein
MKADARTPEPDLEAMLEHARVIPPVSDVVRARALARARATAATASASTVEAEGLPARVRRPSFAAAAAIAFALLAGGAAAALLHRTPAPPPAPPAAPRAIERAPAPPAPVAEPAAPPDVAPQPSAVAKTRRPARVPTPQESYAAELDLLRRAQSAYASRDFSNALVLVAEHGRRFPNGRLAEEREALRVRSLASSGRRGEARNAVDAFANRFPRSVLLPRLRDAVGTTE